MWPGSDILIKYSWTLLCPSGRDPEKYFDIGMVWDNQLDFMGSETFWQTISFKKNAYLQASFYHFTITNFVGEYKIKQYNT